MNRTTYLVIIIVLLIVLAGAFAMTNRQPVATTSPIPTTAATTELAPPPIIDQSATINSPSPQATATTSSSATSQSSTVSYNGSAFTPAILTVTSDTTVTFKNNSTTAMWVASDPHPTHTGLPGFDAKHNIAPGGTYTFTFTKVGTFGYHDHLNDAATGTIVVQ